MDPKALENDDVRHALLTLLTNPDTCQLLFQNPEWRKMVYASFYKERKRLESEQAVLRPSPDDVRRMAEREGAA